MNYDPLPPLRQAGETFWLHQSLLCTLEAQRINHIDASVASLSNGCTQQRDRDTQLAVSAYRTWRLFRCFQQVTTPTLANCLTGLLLLLLFIFINYRIDNSSIGELSFKLAKKQKRERKKHQNHLALWLGQSSVLSCCSLWPSTNKIKNRNKKKYIKANTHLHTDTDTRQIHMHTEHKVQRRLVKFFSVVFQFDSSDFRARSGALPRSR